MYIKLFFKEINAIFRSAFLKKYNQIKNNNVKFFVGFCYSSSSSQIFLKKFLYDSN